jgi:hypothetical protein
VETKMNGQFDSQELISGVQLIGAPTAFTGSSRGSVIRLYLER